MAKSKGSTGKASSKGKGEVINPITVADKDSALNKLAVQPSTSGLVRCQICGHDIELNTALPQLYEEECISRTHKRCWAKEFSR